MVTDAITTGSISSEELTPATFDIKGVTIRVISRRHLFSASQNIVIPRRGVSIIDIEDLSTVLDMETLRWARFQFEEDQLDTYVPTYYSLKEMFDESRLRDTRARKQDVEEMLKERLAAIRNQHIQFTVKTGYADLYLNECFRPQTGSGYSFRWKPESLDAFMGRVRAAERRLAELVSSPLSLVLAENYAKSWRNSDVLGTLVELWIRSGGYIDMLNEAQLVELYAARLEGITHVDEVRRRDLTINLEDYAPRDVVKDLETSVDTSVRLADRSLMLIKRDRSLQAFPVNYTLEDEEGAMVPTGSVTMSLTDYKRNRPIRSEDSLSGLPHKIRLVVILTVKDREVTRGTPGDQLDRRIKSYEGGKRRGALVSPTNGFGRQEAIVGSEIPPWCKSKSANRWR